MRPHVKESFADWMDKNRCAEVLREERWRDQPVSCLFCSSCDIKNLGKYKDCFFRYQCLDCSKNNNCKTTFNDKTGTIFARSKISLQKWFYAIDMIQKKTSTNAIARSLQVDGKTASRMVHMIKGSIFFSVRITTEKLRGEVEADEAYVTSGCKGNNETRPEDRPPRKRGLKKRGRGTYETEKVPILGIVQRQGNIHLEVTKNVKTSTVQPIINSVVAPNTTIYTDEYNIYNFLDRSDQYSHLTVCHSKGEYALDLDGDGIYETHSNTQEGAWSLLRPWLRPHRGINKMYLPLYVAPCEYFYNRRHLTPIQQIRSVISIGVSWIGNMVTYLLKEKTLLTFCSV